MKNTDDRLWVGIDLQSLKKCPHCGRVLFGFKEK
jgi:hypothetical protein